MPRRNSSDSLLHSVKFLLKQTTANEPKWKLQCKYSSLSFSCLRPQIQSRWKRLPTRKNGSQNRNQVVPVSGVSQKSNTIRFRLPGQISQEIARGGGNMRISELVILKAAQSLQHVCLFNTAAFVYQIFCLFSINKKPHKAAQNSRGLMCLNPGCSRAVHPAGESHAA